MFDINFLGNKNEFESAKEAKSSLFESFKFYCSSIIKSSRLFSSFCFVLHVLMPELVKNILRLFYSTYGQTVCLLWK